MLTVKTNAVNEKGNMRPAVRDAVRDELATITITFKNGATATLTDMGHGDWYGEVAQCTDGTVRAAVKVALTVNDYHYNAPKHKAPVDNEVIEIGDTDNA